MSRDVDSGVWSQVVGREKLLSSNLILSQWLKGRSSHCLSRVVILSSSNIVNIQDKNQTQIFTLDFKSWEWWWCQHQMLLLYLWITDCCQLFTDMNILWAARGVNASLNTTAGKGKHPFSFNALQCSNNVVWSLLTGLLGKVTSPLVPRNPSKRYLPRSSIYQSDAVFRLFGLE